MASIAGRLAGKALGDFLKVAAGATAGVAQQAALNYLLKTPETVDAPGIRGKVASSLSALPPELTAKAVGAVAPIALAGGIAGVGAVAQLRQQNNYSLPVQQVTRMPAFATQQYIPGVSPITNEQMGEAILDQQRFQHQLELIQARQVTSAGAGTLHSGSSTADIIGLAQKIYG